MSEKKILQNAGN